MLTILVADDDDAFRDLVVSVLRKEGYGVMSAASGREALEIARSGEVQGVISDVRMPEGDGLWLVEQIKRVKPDLPIFTFMTGFITATPDRAYELGAESILSKPFERLALIEAVRRATTPLQERWRIPPAGIPSATPLELAYPSLALAVAERKLGLGRGGLFVALPDGFAPPEQHVRLRIAFKEGHPQSVDGTGVVRWIRPRSSAQLPAGIGVEFLHLSDASRAAVVEAIAAARPQAFIPRA